MRGEIPFATLQVDGNATVQALSTSDAQFVGFALSTGSAGPNTGTRDGDPSVKADKANNRFLVLTPGIYELSASFSGIISATQNLILKLRKNAATTIFTVQQSWTISVQNSIHMNCVFEIVAADNPGNIPAFPDPVAPAAPAVSFVGGSGAPKLNVPIDFTVASGASTPNLTFANGRAVIKRIG